MSTDDEHKAIEESGEDVAEESGQSEDVSATDSATNITQGILPTQQGNEKALTLMSAFVVLVVAVLASWPVTYLGIHGPDAELFTRDTSLHRLITFPEALEKLPEAPATLFGLSVNAVLVNGSTWGLHLGNLILHALNAMLVFFICRRLFAKSIPDIAATIPAVLVAACPWVAETIGFLSARYILQGSFFGLLFVSSVLKHTAKRDSDSGLSILPLIWLACAVASWHAMIFLPVVGLAASLLRGGGSGLKRLVNFHASTIGLALLLCAAIWATDPNPAQGLGDIMAQLLGHQPQLYLLSVFALPLLPHLLRPVATGPVPLVAGVITAIAVLAGGYIVSQEYLLLQSPIEYWADILAQEEKEEHEYSYVLEAIQSGATLDENGIMDKHSWDLLNQYATGATVLYPLNVSFQTEFGKSQAYLQDLDGAEITLNKALALDPFNHEGALILAQVKDQKVQQGNSTLTQIRDIVDLYEAAELTGPVSPLLQQRHAMLRLGLGDVTGAYQRLVVAQGDSDVENPTLNQLSGLLQRAAQLDQEATEILLKGQGATEGYAKQAEANVLRGNLFQANYQLDRLLRKDTTNEAIWQMLGLVRGQLGQSENFVAEWGTSVLATNEGWRSIGQRCAMSGSWVDGRTYLEQVEPEGDTAPLLLVGLAQLALRMNQMPRALQYLDEAAKTYPDRFEPWVIRAELAISLKQTRDAETFIKEAQQRGMPETQLQKLMESMKESGQSTMGEPTRTIIQ